MQEALYNSKLLNNKEKFERYRENGLANTGVKKTDENAIRSLKSMNDRREKMRRAR